MKRRWHRLESILAETMGLTLELKRTFDDRRPIAEALSSFTAKRGKGKGAAGGFEAG